MRRAAALVASGLVSLALGACLGSGTKRIDATCREMRAVVVWEMLRDNPSIQLVDLRHAPEVTAREGRLPNARVIPFDKLPSRMKELSKERTVVVFARQADEGRKACELLAANGFLYVIFMSDGAEGWFRHGLPSAPAAPTATPRMR